MHNFVGTRSGSIYGDPAEVFIQASPEDRLLLSASLFASEMPERGGILLVPDVFGRTAFYRQIGSMLAAEGYCVLVPEIFGDLWPVADGDGVEAMRRLGALDQKQTLLGLTASFDWLSARVPSTQVGVVGFSLGGTLAMMLATKRKSTACVAFYGFPARRPVTENAPYIVCDHMQDFSGPLLAFWGAKDVRVPPSTISELREASEAAGKNLDLVIYNDLGHSFLNFDPNATDYMDAQDAWLRTTRFLDMHFAQACGAVSPVREME